VNHPGGKGVPRGHRPAPTVKVMRIPDEVLEAIRARVSIVDVVGRHVALKRAGKNWKGLCPFHSEKTPSFVVNEERGTYHCFGCGAGGSAFRFVMEVEGRPFVEAVRALAAQAGVTLAEGPEDPREARAREEREEILRVLALAARYYRHQLVSGRAGEVARAYLERRGVELEVAESFALGCAPAGWDNLARFLRGKGVDPALASRAGLLAPRPSGGYYDRLRDRLVFPIHEPLGRGVSFGGRVLGEGEPKYLNGPESPVFRKSEVLYGLFQGAEAVRRERRVLVVEGYMDVISLHARGFQTALATLGTALTAEHIRLLRRRADEAVLVYDGDAAGRRAAFRGLDLFLAEGFPCRGVLLPPEDDPDSFVRRGGDLRGAVEAAKPLLELYLEELSARFDLATVEGKVAAADEIAPRLVALTDSLARDLYAKRAAETLGVDEAGLRSRMAPGRRIREAPPGGPALDPVEQALLACLLHEPGHRSAFQDRGVEAWMGPGPVREAAAFVATRRETAPLLPVDAAPEAARAVLTRLLVAEELPRACYEEMEAALRLRHLEERRGSLVREIGVAEGGGDTDRVLALQREKTELDSAVAQCKRTAARSG